VADSCWRLRGFGVENGNMMYFFDCTKTSEKPISPWD
jgi:hypothetical protein